MIRPWYRSRLFWLGLSGLVFMLWLWLVKADHSFSFGYTAITGPAETTTRSISTRNGSIYQTTSYASGPGRSGFRWSAFPRLGGAVIKVPDRPFEITRGTTGGHSGYSKYREIQLAWWVVISAYMALWLAAAAGWQWRNARLSRRAAAELPES
jgi:hypothetical protein